MYHVLVTGASGFIGSAIVNSLNRLPEYVPHAGLRSTCQDLPLNVSIKMIGDMSDGVDARWFLKGVDVVVHSAGIAHVLDKKCYISLSEFRKVNVVATLKIASQAAEQGVKRFIFISSIGVNGNQNVYPFTEEDLPDPKEAYAISKMEAEQGLRIIAADSRMEVVIIRPPLVYGAHAPGNFGKLISAIHRGRPLPLGKIYNKRSFVALSNLVDLVICCIGHPSAKNQTFLVADGEDVSTTELLRRLAKGFGKSARLIPLPMKILNLGAALVGKQDEMVRLCSSLRVDNSKAKKLLGWVPPVTMNEEMKEIADSYLKTNY